MPAPAPRWRVAVSALGVGLIVGGIGTLGWLGWQFYGTNIVSERAQAEGIAQLHREWAASVAPTREGAIVVGRPFAIVRIPRFGQNYAEPVIAGVTEDDLARGVGWFPETAEPGEVGNVVLAAHRITHGEPFRNFPELRAGDHVIVETAAKTYTYVLDQDGDARVIDFHDTAILDPAPGDASARPMTALITLVTCAELFHTDNRNVVTGHLLSVQDSGPRADRAVDAVALDRTSTSRAVPRA